MKNDNEKKPNKALRILFNIVSTIIIVALASLTVFLVYKDQEKKNSEEYKIAYTDLVKEIEEEKVEKIELTVGSTNLKVKLKDVEKENSDSTKCTSIYGTNARKSSTGK